MNRPALFDGELEEAAEQPNGPVSALVPALANVVPLRTHSNQPRPLDPTGLKETGERESPTQVSNGAAIAPPQRETLPVSGILRHPDFQPRPASQWGNLESLIEAYRLGAEVPPVVVTRLPGQHGFFLIDGHRRWAAAREAGCERIHVELHSLTYSEAFDMARRLNQAHPKPLQKRALNKAVRERLAVYIAKRRHLRYGAKSEAPEAKSIGEITKELGAPVTERTIRNWLRRDHTRVYVKYWASPNEDGLLNHTGSGGGPQVGDSFSDPVATVADALDHIRAALAVASPEDKDRIASLHGSEMKASGQEIAAGTVGF